MLKIFLKKFTFKKMTFFVILGIMYLWEFKKTNFLHVKEKL